MSRRTASRDCQRTWAPWTFTLRSRAALLTRSMDAPQTAPRASASILRGQLSRSAATMRSKKLRRVSRLPDRVDSSMNNIPPQPAYSCQPMMIKKISRFVILKFPRSTKPSSSQKNRTIPSSRQSSQPRATLKRRRRIKSRGRRLLMRAREGRRRAALAAEADWTTSRRDSPASSH